MKESDTISLTYHADDNWSDEIDNGRVGRHLGEKGHDEADDDDDKPRRQSGELLQDISEKNRQSRHLFT